MRTQNIIILGAGESGVGAAILAKQKGFEVFVSDLGIISDPYRAELEKYGIPYEQEKHSTAKILATADLVIKSPGIPPKADLVQALADKNIPIIDELEFAFRYKGAAKVVAITGSNGKTTTTRLVHHLLQTAGKKAGLVGNVGYSFAKQIALDPQDIYVVEASSFQLDACFEFAPDVAILLNITPDHLDRYGYELDNYIASKLRIVQNLRPDQTFIHHHSDANVARGLSLFFDAQKSRSNFKSVDMEGLVNDAELLKVPHTDFIVAKNELSASLKGRHNWFNTACAVIAALELGADPDLVQKGVRDFVNEAHRLEYVLSIHGVDFINDSKATNVDSVWYALDAMQKPVVWIVGGVDKGNDYSPLFELVKEKVKAIVCMGRDNQKLREVFTPIQPILEETISIHEAIKVATLYAEAGDVVLLSPACASFDLFKNYRDRGDQFKRVLREMHQQIYNPPMIGLDMRINLNPTEHRSDNVG
jgi:UDP-N-acetylmuramoylalanine--D-glutamate ligase